MKKPERLVGFVKHNNIEYSFEFEEQSFCLKLYPPTIDVWKEDNNPIRFLQLINHDPKKHAFIPHKKIEGITSEQDNVIFCIEDSSGSYNGFISFKVYYYFYYSDKLEIDKIEGFSITGHDVNLFYPPQVALESTIDFSEPENRLKQITVSSTEQKSAPCGKYRINENIDANIDVTAYASFHANTAKSPICANSSMITTFSAPVGMDILIDASFNLIRFFKYITYRQNIDIGDIEVFYKNKDNLYEYEGLLVLPNKYERETHREEKERIITYRFLAQHSSKLFDAINKNLLGFRNPCISIDDRHHYSISRFIMILTEFEREYRNIYGQDSGRSDEYVTFKSEIISLITEYLNLHQGKKRKYAKQIKSHVENRDNSFEDNVMNALIDNEEILSLIIREKYEGTYADAIDGISSRIGEVRNGISHSRLDFKTDAIHLSDIHIIEELIYAMRLKEILLTSNNCTEAIKGLFGE